MSNVNAPDVLRTEVEDNDGRVFLVEQPVDPLTFEVLLNVKDELDYLETEIQTLERDCGQLARKIGLSIYEVLKDKALQKAFAASAFILASENNPKSEVYKKLADSFIELAKD
jgi:hypothetical protein